MLKLILFWLKIKDPHSLIVGYTFFSCLAIAFFFLTLKNWVAEIYAMRRLLI